MTRTGNPDDARPRRPWLWLILATVTVILALVIGTQVIGVLVAIISPPEPPLPADTQQVSHENQEYGQDKWVYSSAVNPCEIVKFYRENGGICDVDPVWCFDEQNLAPPPGSGWQPVATCSADSTFSIFAMRWHAKISAGHEESGPTHIELSREISWSGGLPPENP
jgi:hypothetical protein